MGNIADGVTPTRYRMEDEADKFMTVYTGFKFNHLVFLKMTTLENSNVCSMGKDSYDQSLQHEDIILQANEFLTSVRTAFKVNQDGTTKLSYIMFKLRTKTQTQVMDMNF